MKRITVIATAAVLAALVIVNLASAQGKSSKVSAKAVEKKVTAELKKETPIPYDTSTYRAWDSGELQKEIGSKNKDKKKLVMRVWCDYGHDSPSTYWWQVSYMVRAEDKNLSGPNWHEVSDLYALDYNITYKVGGGSPVTQANRINLSGSSANGSVTSVSGSHAPDKPTFTTIQFTGMRSGGPSGIDLYWP